MSGLTPEQIARATGVDQRIISRGTLPKPSRNLAGIEGVMPLPTGKMVVSKDGGKTYLSDFSYNELIRLGWKPGMPLPDALPQIVQSALDAEASPQMSQIVKESLAEAKNNLRPPVAENTPPIEPEFVPIETLPTAEQEKFRAILHQANEYEKQQATAASDMAKMSPGVREAVSYIMEPVTPKPQTGQTKAPVAKTQAVQPRPAKPQPAMQPKRTPAPQAPSPPPPVPPPQVQAAPVRPKWAAQSPPPSPYVHDPGPPPGDPEPTFAPGNMGGLEEPAVEEPAAEEPQQDELGVELAHQPDHKCVHCGYDNRFPDVQEPDLNEKTAFLTAFAAGVPFKKEYILFGGTMRLVFRTLSMLENDLIKNQVRKEVSLDSMLNDFEQIERMMRYRMFLQLCSFTTRGRIAIALPEAISKQGNPNAACTWSDEPITPFSDILPGIETYMIGEVLTTEQFMRAAMTTCEQFNRTVAMLEARKDDEDFYTGTD